MSCSIEDCEKAVSARGWCPMHYRRWRKYANPLTFVNHNERHGKKNTPEYASWLKMKERCYGVNHRYYFNYGGRGVRVCDRWKHSFINFLSDMGEKPDASFSLDRIDGNGDYEPSNCRWATAKQQSRNRSFNRIFSLNGKSQCMSAWAEELGISGGTLSERIERRWSLERALTTPHARPGLPSIRARKTVEYGDTH